MPYCGFCHEVAHFSSAQIRTGLWIMVTGLTLTKVFNILMQPFLFGVQDKQ